MHLTLQVQTQALAIMGLVSLRQVGAMRELAEMLVAQGEVPDRLVALGAGLVAAVVGRLPPPEPRVMLARRLLQRQIAPPASGAALVAMVVTAGMAAISAAVTSLVRAVNEAVIFTAPFTQLIVLRTAARPILAALSKGRSGWLEPIFRRLARPTDEPSRR